MSEDQKQAVCEYYSKHFCCPKCFRRHLSIQYVKYYVGMPGEIDRSLVDCLSCKWSGIVDDLSPVPAGTIYIQL